MSDKIVYITFRDNEELAEYTCSTKYKSCTDETIIYAVLKSINGNNEYDGQKRVLKPIDENKLVFKMILPDDNNLVEHPIYGYCISLYSNNETIGPKTFFAKSKPPKLVEEETVKMYFVIHKEIHERYIIHTSDNKDYINVISVNGRKIDILNPINVSYYSTYVDYVIYTIDVPKKYLNFKIANSDYMYIKDRYNDATKIFLKRSIDVLFKNNKEENNMTTKTAIEITTTSKDISKTFVRKPTSEIKEVIFHYPATIVYWTDGTKTVVKLQKNEGSFDKEKGLAMAIAKRFLKKSLRSHWYDEFAKYLDNDANPCKFGDKEYHMLLKERSNKKDIPEPEDDEFDDDEPCNINELPKKDKDVISDQDIINLFNKGYSISKISKKLGLTEYFVKKYLDAYTNPKTEKKADKILKKAVKNSKKEKKPRGGHHVRRTEITFYSYLTKEESQDILEKTKVKYEGKWKYMSELQKYFDRECKHFAINKFYGNGYSAFELAQMLGVNASAIMRMRNNPI